MLQAVPKSIFSWNFTVSQADRLIADVSMAWSGERAELRVEGIRYEVSREGWLSGRFVMTSDLGVLAVAEKPSAFFRSFVVQYGNRRFQLKALALSTRGFGLTEGSTRVGTIEPAFWSRTTTIDLPDDIDLPVQVFMFWLVLILWRRAARSG